jgi:hypothetical protein
VLRRCFYNHKNFHIDIPGNPSLAASILLSIHFLLDTKYKSVLRNLRLLPRLCLKSTLIEVVASGLFFKKNQRLSKHLPHQITVSVIINYNNVG